MLNVCEIQHILSVVRLCYFMSFQFKFKFNFNVLWDGVNSIQIQTNELNGGQFWNSEFCTSLQMTNI